MRIECALNMRTGTWNQKARGALKKEPLIVREMIAEKVLHTGELQRFLQRHVIADICSMDLLSAVSELPSLKE